MNMKKKALVFISMLILVFSLAACKQKGEAEKPVQKAAEMPKETVLDTEDEPIEKASDAVSDAVDDINEEVDEAADDAEEAINENIDEASKKIDDALGFGKKE